MAVRVGGVALGLLVIALVVRFAVADREHQPGLIAPGSSTAQAGWQPGGYQHSVAPCQAVSGSLLGRVVLHERNALEETRPTRNESGFGAGLAAYQARRTQRRLANQLRYVRSGRASRWPLDPV